MTQWTKNSTSTSVVKLMTSLVRLIARFNVRSAFNQLGLDRKPKSKEESDTDASEKSTTKQKQKKPIGTKKKVSPGFIKLILSCATNHAATKESSAAAVKIFWIHWNKSLDLSLVPVKLEKQDGKSKKRQHEEELPGKKKICKKNCLN